MRQRAADMLSTFVAALRSWADGAGAIGVFVVSLVDSAGLSVPSATDALVIYLTVQHPARWWWYAAAAVAGAVLGSLPLYWIGRRGGEALLERRFGGQRTAAAVRWYRRSAFGAVLVPALLPPPLPFKIFAVLAGATGLPVVAVRARARPRARRPAWRRRRCWPPPTASVPSPCSRARATVDRAGRVDRGARRHGGGALASRPDACDDNRVTHAVWRRGPDGGRLGGRLDLARRARSGAHGHAADARRDGARRPLRPRPAIAPASSLTRALVRTHAVTLRADRAARLALRHQRPRLPVRRPRRRRDRRVCASTSRTPTAWWRWPWRAATASAWTWRR